MVIMLVIMMMIMMVTTMVIMLVTMLVTMMMIIASIGVKRKSANKRLSVSVDLASQLASAKDALATNKEDKEKLKSRKIKGW